MEQPQSIFNILKTVWGKGNQGFFLLPAHYFPLLLYTICLIWNENKY